MNLITHHKVLLEFDVWEPQEKQAREQYDKAILAVKSILTHAGNLKIAPVSEERV